VFGWNDLRVLCLGAAGQVGREICRQLDARGVEAIFMHDLDLGRAESAVQEIARGRQGSGHTKLVASAGNLFDPAGLKSWEFVPAKSGSPRVCRDRPLPPGADVRHRADLLRCLLEQRLGAFRPEIVKRSLIWALVEAYRPDVVVDAINTATVLGYHGDLIQGGRDLSAIAERILSGEEGSPPGEIEDLARRPEAASDLASAFEVSVRMTAFLDTACMIRFVQCLHALFAGGKGIAVPEFRRYVKLHTTGLGGMGFNVRYTHGDTGEPGLSTKLLGKVCAAGSFSQLLLSLAHTPGCDVRMVVPATLIGWELPPDAVVYSRTAKPLPLVDSRSLVACDGKTTLGHALEQAEERIENTGRKLEIPYLRSGENRPYAAEDAAAISALGQMGCVTKEEVARAILECIEGDSRYDVLAATDAALLLPTHTAAVARDRVLRRCRARSPRDGAFPLPSVSLGNLGPTTAKLLYELEILRATFETVERIAREASEMEMTLRACSYLLEDPQGSVLRRQLLSLGIPIFLRRGPGEAGLLIGARLLYPDPSDARVLERSLDPEDDKVREWLQMGWIDLSGERMAWWRRRFGEVFDALESDQAVSRNWLDPRQPFHPGEFLAFLYSVSGGQRKQYM